MTDIVKYEQANALMSLQDVMTLGTVLVKSGYFDGVKDQAQAVVKILYGQELGIGPIAAMRSVYIVNGKPSLDAGLISSLIKRSGRYDYRVAKLDDEGCELQFFEHGKPIGLSTYTRKDAQQAGAFEGKNSYNYKKHPRNMYFARAITNGARWYTADIFSGPIYTPDELDNAPIDVTPQQPAPRPMAPAVAQPVRPPRPDHDADGEVIDGAATASGPVQGEPKAKYDTSGGFHLNLKVDGKNYLIKNASPDLAFLEAGDEVTIISHPETISGKSYNVVEKIIGPKNADDMTAWEERAAAAHEPEEPILSDAVDVSDGAAFLPVEDLPAHL